jgi:hypothetical protein
MIEFHKIESRLYKHLLQPSKSYFQTTNNNQQLQTMSQVPFYTVDAFTSSAFKGNPAAVCIFEGVSFLLCIASAETNPV